MQRAETNEVKIYTERIIVLFEIISKTYVVNQTEMKWWIFTSSPEWQIICITA